MPKFPIHIDNMSLPPKKFTGYVVLGSWNLEALRAIRVRAAKAEVESQSPGLIESAISAIKGHASPWLAMSREGAKSIDRLINARDSSHAAKVALALPGVLCGLLPLGMFSSYIQKLEAGSISDPGSEADLPFQHRSAKEGEIEFKEFIANNPRSETDITGFFADG